MVNQNPNKLLSMYVWVQAKYPVKKKKDFRTGIKNIKTDQD